MCTVTYIPSGNYLYITSNRDEKNWRTPAELPAVTELSSGKVLFPKDGDAGGTWIAGHESCNVVVFLNGGLEAHVPKPPYRKSRGLILLDLIDHSTPFNCFLAVNLNNIEPFTAIIRDNGHLFECRWDGKQKHQQELDANRAYIWSSVTLYNQKISEKRKLWFEKWLEDHPNPTQEEIFEFHQFTGDGDIRNDLKMNREGQVSTVSISSISISMHVLAMEYLDLNTNERNSVQLSFQSLMGGR